VTKQIQPAVALIIILAGLLLSACNNSAPNEFTVNDPAPAFTLPDARGGQVSLTDYQGTQPVLLYFHMAAG
jgi:hypothetical protein